MDPKGQTLHRILNSAPRAYAAGALVRHQERDPDLPDHFAAGSFRELTHDMETRIRYLAEALAAGRVALFQDHLAWLKVAWSARNVDPAVLSTGVECLRQELEESLPESLAPMAVDYLRQGLEALEAAPGELPSYLEGDVPHGDLIRRFFLAALELRRQEAINVVVKATRNGLPVVEAWDEVIPRLQAEVGRMWQMAEIRVAEEHYCSRVVDDILARLRQDLPRSEPVGRRVMVAAVSGNHHGVGAHLVADRFTMAGWDAVLLGADTPTADLLLAAQELKADLLALSANLALHVSTTAELIELVRSDPELQVPVLVGGRPFNTVPDLWQVVGAHGYAPSAREAVAEGDRLVAARG